MSESPTPTRLPLRPSAGERLEAVLAHERREEDRARDVWRHPKETIEFFGITPSMVVAEVYPDDGWYARILAPYVAQEGAYFGIGFSRMTHAQLASSRAPGSITTDIDYFLFNFPAQVRSWDAASANVWGAVAFDEIPPQYYGKVDAVVFNRALHTLQRSGALAGALAETYALLKPGGVVGVEQHRAKPDASDAYASGAKGYLREADVIAAFEAAGFVLEARSEINANPADPADWPNGAWTLPPDLALGLLNQDEYLAIGESDRMTLRFRKPQQFAIGG